MSGHPEHPGGGRGKIIEAGDDALQEPAKLVGDIIKMAIMPALFFIAGDTAIESKQSASPSH